MKITVLKAIAAAAVISLACAASASAQTRIGFTGGFTTTKIDKDLKKVDDSGSLTTYNLGATMQFNLGYGFSIQPSLKYQVRGNKIAGDNIDDIFESTEDLALTLDYKAGYIELPVALQWGPDLLAFRPYLEVAPYLGYAITNEYSNSENTAVKDNWNNANRLELGFSAGVGLEVWIMQLFAHYNLNYGQFKNLKDNSNTFGGIDFGVTFFFK